MKIDTKAFRPGDKITVEMTVSKDGGNEVGTYAKLNGGNSLWIQIGEIRSHESRALTVGDHVAFANGMLDDPYELISIKSGIAILYREQKGIRQIIDAPLDDLIRVPG